MALTVTNKLSNSTLNSQLVKVLQSLETKFSNFKSITLMNNDNYKVQFNIDNIMTKYVTNVKCLCFVCATGQLSESGIPSGTQNRCDIYIKLNDTNVGWASFPYANPYHGETACGMFILEPQDKISVHAWTNVQSAVIRKTNVYIVYLEL